MHGGARLRSTTTPTAAVVGALLAAPAAIHLAMAPVHAGESRREAVALAAAGAVQTLVAGAVLLTRRRMWLLVTAAVQLLAVVAWAVSRNWGLPFELGGPEPVDLVDGATVAFEVAGAAAALAVLRVRWQPTLAVPVVGAVTILTAVVLSLPSTMEHGHDGAVAHHPTRCPEACAGDPVAKESVHAPGRLPVPAAAALDALAAASAPLPCGAVAAASGHGHGSDADSGAVPATARSAQEQAEFSAQWAAAQDAAEQLATTEAAAAAGYLQSSPQSPGVGTHWINWELIDAPFDPARPSMLLFDQRPGRADRLVGFSYWTRSSPGAPDGFAGAEDVWHGHVGLCFVDGWLWGEGVPHAGSCPGAWLNGTDLWMLHAWVVPAMPNDDGRFAGRNRAVCPGDREPIADALTCDPSGR